MPKTINQNKSYLFALLSVFLWSTSASAFKITLRFANFYQLLFISVFTSLVIIYLTLLFTKKLKLIFKITKGDFLLFLFLGFLNPFFYYLILFKAYSLIPAQLAQPLNFVWPLMIVLISIPILKQKISAKSIIAILISFFGVILISTKGNFAKMKFDNPLGIFLALFSSIVWALFWVLSVKDKSDGLVKLFYLFLFGFVFVALYFFLFTNHSIPNFYGILGSVYIGFFEMGFTFVSWYYALYYSESTAKVNNLVYLTPFFSLIFIAVVVREKILLSTVFGLILILTGILVQNYKRMKFTG